MIFILEDDDNIRNLICYSLKSQKFEVQNFALPSLFYKTLETQTPELLLIDIMLPVRAHFVGRYPFCGTHSRNAFGIANAHMDENHRVILTIKDTGIGKGSTFTVIFPV